ncbi:hypothetical protein ACP70R_045238 [Stipagrostis hirtigluma subsp. patula]
MEHFALRDDVEGVLGVSGDVPEEKHQHDDVNLAF